MAKKQTPETIIKKEITVYLKIKGWFVFPILQGMGAYKGISDLIACKDGIVLFIEVKTPKGKMSEHQYRFKYNMHHAGCHYIIARCHEDVKEYIEWIVRRQRGCDEFINTN